MLPGHNTPPAATLGPAPDLTSAFTNRPAMGVAEIETSVLGCDSANGVLHVPLKPNSDSNNRAGNRTSQNIGRTSQHIEVAVPRVKLKF